MNVSLAPLRALRNLIPFLAAVALVAGGCSDDDNSTEPVVDRPAISSLSPDTVTAGTTVLVRGTRFGATRGASQLLFGGLNAQSLTWSDTRVLAVVPDGVANGNLIAVVGGVESSPFAYRAANRPPFIDSINPTSAEVGGTILFRGERFGVLQGNHVVRFGAIEATATAWSDTLLQATVPAGAASGMVQVTARGLASNEVPFTLLEPLEPAITAVEPDSGLPGVSVRIDGQHFGAGAAPSKVRIGGVDAETTAWTDTRIDAIVPAGAVPGNVTIQVTAGNLSSNGFPFKVLQESEPVVITRLEPWRTTTGDIITIYGTGFRNQTLDAVITFQGANGRIPTTMTSWGQGSMRAWVPQGAVDGPVVVQFGEEISDGVDFSVAPRRISFTNDVHPLFEAKACLECHSGPGAEANLRLTTKFDATRSDSDHGPVVVFRNSADSPLVQKVGPNPPFGARMPFGCETNCLSDEEILLIADWIDQGGDN